MFILWQNSRIVVSKLKVLFTNSLLNSIRTELLAFALLLLNERQGRLPFIVKAECINMSDFNRRLGSGHNYTQSRKPLSFKMSCKNVRVFL